MSSTIARMAVVLSANTASFERGMAKATKTGNKFGVDFQKFSARVSKSFKAIAVASAAMAVTVGASLTVLTKAGFASVDALAKTARRLNISTEALAGFQHAGKLAGIQIATMNMGLQRLTRRIAEAAAGTGEAQGALKELGLDAKKLGLMNLEQQFKAVVDAFAGVSATRKLAVAFKLFDSEGTAILNVIEGGLSGLKAAADEAERFGLAISGTQAAGVERANDAITKIKATLAGIGQQLAVRMAPKVEDIANVLLKWEERLGGVDSVLTNISDTFGKITSLAGLGILSITTPRVLFAPKEDQRNLLRSMGLLGIGERLSGIEIAATARIPDVRTAVGADRPASTLTLEMLQEMRDAKEAAQATAAMTGRLLRIAESGGMP